MGLELVKLKHLNSYFKTMDSNISITLSLAKISKTRFIAIASPDMGGSGLEFKAVMVLAEITRNYGNYVGNVFRR